MVRLDIHVPEDLHTLHLYDWFSCMLVPLFRMLYVICFTETPVDSSDDFVVSLLVLQLCQITTIALFLHILQLLHLPVCLLWPWFLSESGHSSAQAHLLLASAVVAPLADSSGSQQSSSTLTVVNSLWRIRQEPVSGIALTQWFTTCQLQMNLQLMKVTASMHSWTNTCLSPALVVRMILFPGGRWTLTGFVTWRHWPSVQLVMSSVNIAAIFCQKMQRHWFSWSTKPTYWTRHLELDIGFDTITFNA